MNISNLINIYFIKKFTKSGKKRISFDMFYVFSSVMKNKSLLHAAILHLMIPVKCAISSNKTASTNAASLIHFHTAFSLALTWLFKGASTRESRKLPFYKALYLECRDVLKKRGTAYTLKRKYCKYLANSIY